MVRKTNATIKDLYKVNDDAKAEIVKGEVVVMPPTGAGPNFAAGEIFASLREYARRTHAGRAVTDNAGFRVNLPNRQSFSPDAAFHVGEASGMEFFEGAPLFAAEVRSAGDYGANAERRMSEKRADYFAAGTLIVWDVDLAGEVVVRAYHSDSPENPLDFRRGDQADAEPALPGWRLPVDDLFV